MRSYVVPPADEHLAAVDLGSAQIFGMEGAWCEAVLFSMVILSTWQTQRPIWLLGKELMARSSEQKCVFLPIF